MENEKDLNGSENFKKITDKLVADANRVGESPVNAIEFQEALMNDYSGYSSNILSGDIGRRIDDADWKNAYNSTISGLAQLGNNTVRGVGIINGKLKQAVGTLTDNEEMIDSGVFLQDYYRNLMLNYQDRLSYAYSVKDQSLASEMLSKFTIGAISLVPIVATGGVAGGVVAGAFALGAAGEYAADLDSKYDRETWKKVQESKSLDRQFAELGGAGIIGAANYYLDKAFGANPAASNMFGSVIKGGLKKIIKTGTEEALTETAQDLTTPIVQFLMGDKKFSEVVDNIVSRDTFTTLVSSFLVGGGAGGAQYYSAREKVATQVRTAIDRALPNANNAQKSAITEQIVNRDIQGGLTELRSALYADNQLREQYGLTFDRIVNRINDLIDQNIAQGELPDWVNIKSPAERAQYVGSVANRFVDELYAQSILRNIPVLEVFNESRIDVENGNMYMYGKNYGRRNLASYRDLSPEEYTAVMVKEQESELALIQNKVSDLQAKYKVQALRLQELQANEKSKESAIEGAKLRLDKIQKDIDLQTSKINAIQTKADVNSVPKFKKQEGSRSLKMELGKFVDEATGKTKQVIVFDDIGSYRVVMREYNEDGSISKTYEVNDELELESGLNVITQKFFSKESAILFAREIELNHGKQNKQEISTQTQTKDLPTTTYPEAFENGVATDTNTKAVFLTGAQNPSLEKPKPIRSGKQFLDNLAIINTTTHFNDNGVKIEPVQVEGSLNDILTKQVLFISKDEKGNYFTIDRESGVISMSWYDGDYTAFWSIADYELSNKDFGDWAYSKIEEMRTFSKKGQDEEYENIHTFEAAKSAQITPNLLNQTDIEGAKLRLDKIQKDIDLQTSKINAIQNKILEFTKTKPLSSKKIGSYNPLTGILKVKKGFNETTIPHELSHFWLDNMNKFANSIVGRDTEFAKLWSNIRAYLNIMDGQKYLTQEQYEKYTSAYMQYIRKNTIAPKVDLGFDSMDKWIGKISLDYFMNDLGKYGAELSKITPEIAESLQSITTFDLTTAIKNIQDNPEIMEGLEAGAIGKEATIEQMEKVVAKDEKVAKEIVSSDKISAVEDVIAAEKEFGNTNVKYPKNLVAVKDTKEKYVYDVGISDEKSRSVASEFVKDSRVNAELVANGFMDAPNGISRAFVIEALINEDIAAGRSITQWAEALVDSASASGAELRASGVIRENKNYLIDMTEVLKARKYAVALRLYPSAINSLRSRSQILQTFDDKVESWIDEVMPQLEKATSPEEISLIATKWAGKHAKELGATPTGNLFQTVAGISGKRTDLVGNKIKLMRKKLREFLESEAGANLTESEQENLRLKEEATIEAMREVASSDENSFEAEKKVILTAREYQNYKNSLVPQSVWASLFSSIPRASMLFRVSTQLKNFLGTRIENMVLAQINRYMRYGKSDLISDSLIKEEFKRSMKLYGVGNFSIDVQKNFLEQPILAWGEKQYNITTRTTGEGVKKWLFSGLKEEFNKKATDKNALSGIVRGSVGIWERFTGLAFDLLSYTDARAKAYSNIQETAQYASFVAKEMQKENNWSDAETKEQATAIFKDARLFNPKTQLGRNARNMGVDAAKLETFIKAGIFSQAANAFRKKLNFNKEWGIGTFIAPFISTPANILELGLDYATGFTSWVGLRQVKDRIVQNAKEGKPIDVKDMAVLQRAYRGKIGIAGLALYLIALAAIDDDDFEYVPPYSSLTKEQRLQVFRLNGGIFNAIKFGDVYVNVDYFGGLTTPLRLIGTMIYTENLMQTVMATALEIPMAGDLIDEYKSLEQDVNYNKSTYDVAVASFLSQSKKFVPGIVQQIDKAVSGESPAYKIITGSDFGLETGDKEMIDLQEKVGAKIGKITSTKGFGGLDRDTKLKIEKEYDADYYKAAREWYESNKTATDEEIKEEFDSIRKNLLKKYKNLYTID